MFFLLRKLKSAILWVIRVVRRAFCCFRLRSVHEQLDDTSECLTHVGVVPNRNQEQDWATEWGERRGAPQTVEEHIQSYRERLTAVPPSDPTSQVLQDMFQELEPQVIQQKRVIIAPDITKTPDTTEQVDLSRLSAINNFSSELGEWLEESSSGWDEQQLDATEFIRQQKRASASHSRNKLHTTKLAA